MIKFLLFSIFGFVLGSNEETELREYLMEDYNKYVRPVEYFNDTLEVRMGLAVQESCFGLIY